MLALVLVASASFNSALADKKKKKTEAAPAKQVVLATGSDSLSYTAGRYLTQGLTKYLEQEYMVDTAYIKDVVAGFNEGISRSGDPQYQAYNAGAQVARMLLMRMLPSMQSQFEGSRDSINTDVFTAGFRDALLGDTTLFTDARAGKFFEQRAMADREEATQRYKVANEKWLADNRTKEGVKTTPSGLQYKVITQGTGVVPTKDDRVVAKYEGRMIDGTVFDSSYKRNPQTSEFPVSGVIKGWTEALTMMPVGSKWELYIPAELGYGTQPAGRIKPNSTLIFTVELVDVKKQEAKPADVKEEPAKTPATVKAAPTVKKGAAKKAAKKK